MNHCVEPTTNPLSGLACDVLQAQQVYLLKVEEMPELTFASFNWARHVFPNHFHTAYEVVLIQEGAVCVNYRKVEQVLPAGSFFAFQPEEARAYGPLEGRPYTSLSAFIEVPLAQKLLSEIAPERANPFRLIDVILPDICAHSFEELYDSFWYPASALERESTPLLFLAALLPYTSDECMVETDSTIVTLVKDYLRDHLHAKITIADMSELTGLSKYHLIRTFKRAAGITLHGFLVSLRIEHVKTLLKAQVPVGEAARQTGFSDQAHLSRLFKRYNGVSPSQYRRETSSRETL